MENFAPSVEAHCQTSILNQPVLKEAAKQMLQRSQSLRDFQALGTEDWLVQHGMRIHLASRLNSLTMLKLLGIMRNVEMDLGS